MFKGKSLLITGGTGSFGRHFARYLLGHTELRRVIIYSRDELKQHEMRGEFDDDPRLRFFIGDVRDLARLQRAFADVDYVVHAAALKQVPAAEYNPFECIKTNVHGAYNVIEAALDSKVQKIVALSTDKAVNPINLYGATKLCSDKLFVSGNAYAGGAGTRFVVVRYGNVSGSRGSVVPVFKRIRETGGTVTITDERMTRFWITLDEAVQLVLHAFDEGIGGEIFVPKIPSMLVTDLADAICPGQERTITGIRPGEKLHECMITEDDARQTRDRGDYYIIYPDFPWYHSSDLAGEPVPEGFRYSSEINDLWLSIDELRGLAGL
tara:strand:+ start:2862 stop:3830 length:969 start_codon:yes stop_codon:yes gene_type:complete